MHYLSSCQLGVKWDKKYRNRLLDLTTRTGINSNCSSRHLNLLKQLAATELADPRLQLNLQADGRYRSAVVFQWAMDDILYLLPTYVLVKQLFSDGVMYRSGGK